MPLAVTEVTRRLLLSRSRLVMIGVGSVAALLVVGAGVVEKGEIVKLTTWDAEGHDQVTELWVVDLPSGIWLRAAVPRSGWVDRIRENPEVSLERDGASRRYLAAPVPDAALRARVNRAMAVKYGLKDRLWSKISDHGESVPVRLVPADDGTVAAGP